MSNPIQIPYLRDLPIHEGAGLQQAGGEDQLGQLAKLLMLKGHLALEQEKFQSEEQERKQKKQTLAGLSQTLSGLFQGAQTPEQIQSATAASIGPLAGAGETGGAAAAMRDLPGLQQQTQLGARQRALGLIMNEFKQQNVQDPRVQARTLAQIEAVDQEAGRNFAEGLKALGGRFTFYTDVQGQHWIGDTQKGTEHKGELGAPRSGAGGIPITTKEAQVAAGVGVQGLVDAANLLKGDKDADIMPLLAAGLAGAKAGGGSVGAAAGFFQPFAEMQKTPHQQSFGAARDLFKEAYMSVITGKRGVGSPLLQNVIDNALFPLAGQTDPEVRAAKARTRARVQNLLMQLASGKVIDMDQLPGYREARREALGLAQEGAAAATPNMPGGLGQAPLGFDDLLRGVPPRQP